MTLARSTGQTQRRYGKNLASLDQNGGSKNLLTNGCFRLAQRGTPIISTGQFQNDDDSYVLDRWNLLSDGDDIVDVSQETTEVPTGAYASIALDVETANKKFGIIQFIESKDCARIVGRTCSLSFEAKIAAGSTSIANLMAAVLYWDDAEDSVTTDVVNAWNGAGTAPGLVANWAYANTPSSLDTLTTSFQKFTIENISVDSSAVNVAVFIWSDDITTTVGHIVYIANVQLEEGAYCTEFEHRNYGIETARCQRYFFSTFPPGTNPAQSAGLTGSFYVVRNYGGTSITYEWYSFPVRMRGTPSCVYYNPEAANTKWRVPGSADSGTASTNTASVNGVFIRNANGGSAGVGDVVAVHFTADAEL